MIVLWILIGIIAFIVILLHFSISVEISGGTDGEFHIGIKYMGFTIYPRNKKNHGKSAENVDEITQSEESKEKETDKAENFYINEDKSTEKVNNKDEQVKEEAEEFIERNEKKKVKGEEKNSEKKSKNSSKSKFEDIKEKYELIKPYIPIGWKYFKKMLKTIRFTNTRINISAGKDDAYESAMFYGKIQGVLFNFLAVLSGIFTVEIKEAEVKCIFNQKVFDAKAETVIKVRPSAMISIVVCLGVSFLVKFIPSWLRKRAEKKKKVKILSFKGIICSKLNCHCL